MSKIGWVALAAVLLGQQTVGAEASPTKPIVKKSAKSTPRSKGVLPRGMVQTASGLRYRILKAGSGNRPTDADVTLVNYTGKLLAGTVFDKSAEPTQLPVAGVVPGFAEALKLMRRGAKYRVWIPAPLGYGAKDIKDGDKVVIPANSTLVFDIEMIDFLPADTPDLTGAFEKYMPKIELLKPTAQ